jgi:threonine aldolase
MRRAMAEAEVGDDQYGEDPSVNRLQETIAGLLGKEEALFLPSGTMANQVALLCFTRPGDEVITSRESHALWHENGAGSANAGVQFTEVGAHGVFDVEQFLAAVKPAGHPLYPPTTLLQIENTHNRAGGVVVPQPLVDAVCAAARERGIARYLDGARLWNASIASSLAPARLAAPFDMAGVALSKGLGAPAGSLLAGSRELIAQARRHRRRLGGAMRQAGILAAAGLYALEHHLPVLGEDHANARLIASRLVGHPALEPGTPSVETNILICRLAPDATDAPALCAQAAARGLLAYAFGPRILRLVTHRDVGRPDCERAATILLELLDG